MSQGFQEQRKQRFQKIQELLEEEDHPDRGSAITLISVETGLTIEKSEEYLNILAKAGKIPDKYRDDDEVPVK